MGDPMSLWYNIASHSEHRLYTACDAMVVQADLWMERHLCENSTEYAHLYAIRDKLMGSMVTWVPTGTWSKVCSVPERSQTTLWHLDSSVQWCTRLWMHARIWQGFSWFSSLRVCRDILGRCCQPTDDVDLMI
jgi:hypothetical protein